ncbi:MAG: UDP-N-acetylmuramoyl-L-alanine--D-glutamate ligase [Chloroflexi bacterium]|nr:UDP-N-acetylmuramoyl-L-alanine--D-glutamate ligase [Chloroflexota bacterium]
MAVAVQGCYVVLGAARQGTALARFLAGRGAQVVLTDMRAADELKETMERMADVPVEWVLGEHPLALLDRADCVCPSGGVPLTIPFLAAARARGIPFTNDSQVFLEHVPCRVAGITGSAGKTTTTTLLGRMAGAAEGRGLRRAWVGGNIGTPLLAALDEMQADDLCVMELSSFQLEIMTRAPQAAALLNVTPNHLDRHGTMEAYTAAKANILIHQKPEDAAVLGRDDPGAWALRGKAPGRLLSFGLTEPEDGVYGAFLRDEAAWLRDENGARAILPFEEVLLPGDHNRRNVLAACALAAAAGLPDEAMRAGVQGFRGVPHRLEFVRTRRGVDWINDSKATIPSAVVTALNSIRRPVVLLLGGRDKHLPWEELALAAAGRAAHVILFGEAAGLIRAALEQAGGGYALTTCPGLEDAVQEAARRAEAGMVVLLSPGCTSFDEFADYEQRGERFKEWALALED